MPSPEPPDSPVFTQAGAITTPGPSVSVVVPVYNGQESLVELVERLEASLAPLTGRWEVILVNDGSRDQSWPVICQLAADHSRVRGLNLMRNYGQHNALLAGILQARHDVIVTLDDDLQNPPEEVPNLIAKLAEGFDVVYGAPSKEQHGFWRNIASRVTKLTLQTIMGAETARRVSAFRAFRTQVRDAFASYRSPYVSIDVLLTWGTTRFAAVQVQHEPRRTGVSNYTFSKLVIHALNLMTGFSTWPLKLASFIGFGFTLFGLGILAYVVGRYIIQGGSIPGFPFLASVIAIFSGAQLFALGVIGEYLARIHYRMMDRPAYTVRESTADREG